jgi:dephospho-CoA kinase
VPRSARLAAADDILRNDGDLDALHDEAETLHRRYLELARARRAATDEC